MKHVLSEITTSQADLIKSFAVFYLLLIGNYIGNSLFTCFQLTYIKNNKWLQLLISFFLFYFLVTVFSNTGQMELVPPIEKLFYTFFYFIGFLCVMRLDIWISIIVIILIFSIYFIELNKDFYLEGSQEISNSKEARIYKENQYWITLNWPFKIKLFPVNLDVFPYINQIETAIYYLIIVLLVLGFISYGGEIKDTLKHSSRLTWVDVIMDTQICRLKDRKSFWHYLVIGLGLKL